MFKRLCVAFVLFTGLLYIALNILEKLDGVLHILTVSSFSVLTFSEKNIILRLGAVSKRVQEIRFYQLV